MTHSRPPKKSDSIEVRIPHATKRAFMDRCRSDRRTASDAIRSFIDAEIGQPAALPPPARSRGRTMIAVAIGAALGFGVASPSLAKVMHGGPATAPTFDQLDADHDGVLSRAEYAHRHQDGMR